MNECALSFCDGPSDTLIRFVGALQLQVSFAKEPYKRDDLLRCRLVMARAIHWWVKTHNRWRDDAWRKVRYRRMSAAILWLCDVYSLFQRRWDSKWSSECKTKSSMVVTGLCSNGSFEKRPVMLLEHSNHLFLFKWLRSLFIRRETWTLTIEGFDSYSDDIRCLFRDLSCV